ncbi:MULTISPECIES: SDR family NAD(P)-dependent oxidoreductase [Novosphingobium]|uniref:SDR family NAD(P)-dependent oxidoreductase n=1 Tax=Novosphingobium TaxID=165696 RepID=UPI001CD4BDED|nr:glucose 1-dehydrogenase [Novosphingobium percolationis]
MSGRLQGKVALVTGGCSGIGLGIVERFVAEGAKVLAADVQDEKGANLEARFGGKVAYRHCDVTQEADIAAACAAAASEFGGLDILINNAGAGGPPTGSLDTTAEGWDWTQALLLRAPMLGTKHAAPLMIARGGGAVVNIASIAAFEAGWGLAYGVAKAGVLHLSKLSAADLAVHNIRVNAICPGVIVTPIFGMSIGLERAAADQMTAALVESAGQMQPIRRAGAPADIAGAAVFLASEDASFVTGTHLVVDGGITVGQRISWNPEALLPIHVAMAPHAPTPEDAA